MRNFSRPKLVLSRCLELDPCRYNGQSIRARIVHQLEPFVELVAVCPEVEIGLGVPRPPVRLVSLDGGTRLMQPSTGRDVTLEMQVFSAAFLSAVGSVDGFLLKARSPSCGTKDVKVYAAVEGVPPSGTGPGLFAGAVLQRHPGLAIEDEGRLTNFRLRHHFLAKLFALAALRDVELTGRIGALVDFHATHKLALMAQDQDRMRALGRIVANPERLGFEEVVRRYRSEFELAMEAPARPGANVNVLQHAQGYFKEGLSSAEKGHFTGLLNEYRHERVSLSAPLAVVQGWTARFGEEYLAAQSFFEPYPRELLTLHDSGGDTRVF